MITPKDNVEVNYSDIEDEQLYFNLAELADETKHLKSILVYETEMLRQMRISKVEEIHEEKLEAIRRLETQYELLARHPEKLSEWSKEDVSAFKILGKEMDKVARENFHEVSKAKEVNQRVVEAVAHAVSRHDQRASGYSRDGIDKNSVKAHIPNSINTSSVAFSQSI